MANPDQMKRDMQFLLWQLRVIEHEQDNAAIAEVAKRNGIAFPIYDDPREPKPRLKAKERRVT